MVKLSTILDQIDSGTVLLPEFQRGYVWNRDQVRGLMRSLYRDYPVGGLLLWETDEDSASIRGKSTGRGIRLLLLDGQQRITSLYGVIRGRAPAFFDGDALVFTGLHFNVEDETFEFYAPAKMRDDDRWIDVTSLFSPCGLGPYFAKFSADPSYLTRLNRLCQIVNRDFHTETITGKEKTVDVVVDIFNRVNSGGTELSKGDLALAKLCAQWPDARKTMRDHLQRWKRCGFNFSLDWLLRNVTGVATGRSVFTALDGVTAEEFAGSLDLATRYIGAFLDATSGRLGLDHDRVLLGRGAMPVITRLLHLCGGRFDDASQRDRALFWYVHAGLWGRFAGSTETVLAQDYNVLGREGIDGLIDSLERWRGGSLDIKPHDFEGSTRGSRFYPLLYLLTRVKGARDLGSGLGLRAEMLGNLTSLQIHHIFPKALLYRVGFDRSAINAIANFCFLTQDTNLAIGKRPPQDYFAEVEARHPGALASQWIPTDRNLWHVEAYWDFLAARRELLADAAQSFLTELRHGSSWTARDDLQPIQVVIDETDDARTAQVKALVEELVALGCAEPALDSEIADPATGHQLAVAEAFWADGLQPGQGQPIVLELDPASSDVSRMAELGYEVFTSVDALRGFVLRRNESAAGHAIAAAGKAEPVARPATESEFDRAMRSLYDRARQEPNYPAAYFLRMLAEYGGLGTARRLLQTPAVSDGFAKLWERERLDLTVEALVIQPCFAELFTDAERETARHRLDQFGHPSWSERA